jgi:hypothetical protein
MRFKEIWKRCNPFDVKDYFKLLSTQLKEVNNKVEQGTQSIHDSIVKLDEKLQTDIALLEKDLAFERALNKKILETVPDMLWAKDLQGKYLRANKAIREKLLLCDDPIGRDDIELATRNKAIYGEENHTFGGVCEDSDKDVIEKVKNGTWGKNPDDGRYFEYGNIKGKMVYIEVYKEPLYVDNVLVGTCGAGRIMTPYVELEQKQQCKEKCGVESIFEKFKFANRGHNGE